MYAPNPENAVISHCRNKSKERWMRMGSLDFLYRADLPHRALSVYIYLRDRANKRGECRLQSPPLPVIWSCHGQRYAERFGIFARQDTLKPTSDTEKKAARAVYYISWRSDFSKSFLQGGSLSILWQVPPIIMEGESELSHSKRIYSRKKTNNCFAIWYRIASRDRSRQIIAKQHPPFSFLLYSEIDSNDIFSS